MDEIINHLKQTPEIKQEIKDNLIVLHNQNYATQNDALTIAFSQQHIYRKAIEVAKVVMLEQQDEIEILECENIELKNIIGNNEISTDVMNKVFKKVHSVERSAKGT